MAFKFIVLATVLAACNAGPVWISDYPPAFFRTGRAPLSYGYGSGFASNIGGVTHTSGISSSLSTDGSPAYSNGVGLSDGNYARGIGIAGVQNTYPIYRAQPTYVIPQLAYSNAVSSAQNYGGYNTAVSSANSGSGRAVSSAQNIGGYESAYSSVNNGFKSATSAASNNGYGRQNAISTVQTGGPGYRNVAVSAAEQDGLYKGSTAQTLEQHGNIVEQNGASNIYGPGIQAAHASSVRTGYY